MWLRHAKIIETSEFSSFHLPVSPPGHQLRETRRQPRSFRVVVDSRYAWASFLPAPSGPEWWSIYRACHSASDGSPGATALRCCHLSAPLCRCRQSKREWLPRLVVVPRLELLRRRGLCRTLDVNLAFFCQPLPRRAHPHPIPRHSSPSPTAIRPQPRLLWTTGQFLWLRPRHSSHQSPGRGSNTGRSEARRRTSRARTWTRGSRGRSRACGCSWAAATGTPWSLHWRRLGHGVECRVRYIRTKYMQRGRSCNELDAEADSESLDSKWAGGAHANLRWVKQVFSFVTKRFCWCQDLLDSYN